LGNPWHEQIQLKDKRNISDFIVPLRFLINPTGAAPCEGQFWVGSDRLRSAAFGQWSMNQPLAPEAERSVICW